MKKLTPIRFKESEWVFRSLSDYFSDQSSILIIIPLIITLLDSYYLSISGLMSKGSGYLIDSILAKPFKIIIEQFKKTAWSIDIVTKTSCFSCIRKNPIEYF